MTRRLVFARLLFSRLKCCSNGPEIIQYSPDMSVIYRDNTRNYYPLVAF